jgi:hypothetical protein
MGSKKVVVDQTLFNEMVAFIGDHERCDDKGEYWPSCAKCGVSTRNRKPHAEVTTIKGVTHE